MIETDPDGKSFHDHGSKGDSGKVLAGVLSDFSLALLEVAKVGTYGAKKYSRGGWQGVESIRYTDAMWRHLLAERHSKLDESGLSHLAQVCWNALAVLELELRGENNSDLVDEGD